jgi:hypothetical protein
MKKLTVLFSLAGCVAAGSALAADIDWSKLPPAAKTDGVTFDKDIAPLMKASCVRCHGAERPKAGLRLDTRDGVLKGTKDGPAVVAGDSANSLLVQSISQLDPEIAMPPKPRGRRGPGGPGGDFHPPGTNAPALEHREGGPGGDRPHLAGGESEHPPGMPPGTNGPGMRPRNFGPQMKPLTADEVGLVRAWIDQGAK